MAKEPIKPNDKSRLAMNLTDSSKQLIDLFGGDKKHFEPIEDDEDDLVAKPSVTEAAAIKSSADRVETPESSVQPESSSKSVASRDSQAGKTPDIGEPTSDVAPAKPVKGIKSHWANLAAALGLRKKDPVETTTSDSKSPSAKAGNAKTKASPTSKSVPAAQTAEPTPPAAVTSAALSPAATAKPPVDSVQPSASRNVSDDTVEEWPKSSTSGPQISFDDLFANAPDLTESQVSPEAFLGASGLDDVDTLETTGNEIGDDADSDYVEFELAELDPVDRPQRIGRVDAPPPAAESAAESESRGPRKRRRRRRGKNEDKAAEVTEVGEVESDVAIGSPDADPAPRSRDSRNRSSRSDSAARKPASERTPNERSSSERTPSERSSSERPVADRPRRERDASSDDSERKPRDRQARSERPSKSDRSSGARQRGGERADSSRGGESRSVEPRNSAKPKRDPAPAVDTNGDDYIEYDGNPDLELTDDAKRVTTWREAIDVIIDGNLSNRKRGGKPSGGGSRSPRNPSNDRRR